VRHLRLSILALSTLALTSCGRPAELNVVDVMVKLSPVQDNPSALYFTVRGGERKVDLLRVTSPSVIRLEMHETVSDPKTGMLTMKTIDRIAIPAKGEVEFKRGGKHVMLYGVNRVARDLGKMDTIFIFSDGSQIKVTAPVEKIADGDGKDSGGHTGH
jgi:periplasmic copper chaperone A